MGTCKLGFVSSFTRVLIPWGVRMRAMGRRNRILTATRAHGPLHGSCYRNRLETFYALVDAEDWRGVVDAAADIIPIAQAMRTDPPVVRIAAGECVGHAGAGWCGLVRAGAGWRGLALEVLDG